MNDVTALKFIMIQKFPSEIFACKNKKLSIVQWDSTLYSIYT
jgi:hypothetical protein